MTIAKGNIRLSTFCHGYFRTPSNTQTHARIGQIITRADTSRLDCNTHRRKSARGSLLCHWWRNDIVRMQSKREQRNRSDGPSRILRTNSCSILGRRLDHLGESGGFDPSPYSLFVYVHLLYIIDIISLKPGGVVVDLCLVGRNRSPFLRFSLSSSWNGPGRDERTTQGDCNSTSEIWAWQMPGIVRVIEKEQIVTDVGKWSVLFRKPVKPRPLLRAYISIHHHPAALMRLFSSNAPLLFARFLASAAARDQLLRRPVVKINSRTATDEKCAQLLFLLLLITSS